MPLDGRQTRDIRALFRRPGDVGGFDVLTPGADDGRGRPRAEKLRMSMQIVEKSGEGLSRVYGVTVPASELATRLEARIAAALI